MTQRTYGSRYDENLTVKEIAALVRAELRTAQKDGILPTDWKFTVRSRRFSGGQSIDIAATSPRPIYAADPAAHGEWVEHGETGEFVMAWVDKLTLEARFVLTLMEDLVAAFNHDGSDSQSDHFDVRFYSHPTVSTAAGVPTYLAAPAAGPM